MTAVYDHDTIRSEMERAGSHWWSESSMRFFRTRLVGRVYNGPGGVYFVTSERNPSGVRRYLPDEKSIETVGAFHSYNSAKTAQASAAYHAETCGE